MKRHAAGVPEGSQIVEVDGVALAVAREGAGPPVVCLHAITHGGGDFAAFAARAKDRFEIVRIDWPGHGRSGDDRQPTDAARCADLLEGALDALGLGSVILLGNSIGGAAAIIVAARSPARVRGLVLCDPGGLAPIGATEARAIKIISAMFGGGARGAWWFNAAFAFWCGQILKRGPARDQRRRIVTGGKETAARGLEAWASFAEPAADIRDLGPKVTAPTLLAWSKGDQVIPFAKSKAAIQRFPNAETAFFPGGHAAFLEAPDRFAKRFFAFADALPAPAAARTALHA